MAGRKRRTKDEETITATKALPGAGDGADPSGPAARGPSARTPASAGTRAGSAGMKSGGRTLAAKASAARSAKTPRPEAAGRAAGQREPAAARTAAGTTSGTTSGNPAGKASGNPAGNRATGSAPDPARTRGRTPTPEAGRKPPATVLAFPEPPRRKRRRNAWIAAVSALLLTGLFFAFLFFSPALALKTVVVEGTQLLPREQAEAALEPLKGRTLPSISDADVESLLADRPEIESLKVAAQPPSTLLVTVTERMPVAVLQDGAQHVLIDEEGRRLAVAADRAAVPLPLIAGGTEAVNAEVFPSITSVLAALPAEVLGRLESASAQTVDSVELKLNSGQTVFWGSADASAAKARVLEALLKMAPTDPPVEVYDVSAPDRPVTR
ncbi:cell division protein FtsQ/DivIB [Arthrobacter sp. YD2]|uniref:cell division protein FtsQ/DivIB n=1 Tax=Arthrobacter sp. YD2 TaxID=3058046 RepID=UPI0025B50725|nr:cell division protein FtsQ/DivIB [Arthrobacter sp. YD2]MDN3904977.1 FtsQ-type POTRA domain-containing protein [Arthrobacter sp. YD2]